MLLRGKLNAVMQRIALGKKRSGRDFAEVMSVCRTKDVSKSRPRDRVLASARLANPALSTLVEDKMKDEDFDAIIASHHIYQSGTLDVLTHVTERTEPEDPPSWCPNSAKTSSLPARRIVAMAATQSFGRLYKASRGSVATATEDDGRLTLLGNYVDGIKTLGAVLPLDADRCSLLEGIQQWMQLARVDESATPYDPIPSISKYEAFWRTITMDVDWRYGVCGSPERESGDWSARRQGYIDWHNDLQCNDSDTDGAHEYPDKKTSWLAWRLEEHLRMTTCNRRFAVSTHGHFCLVPASAGLKDEVWVLLGAKFPLVLSPSGTDRRTVQGVGYVQGMMDGDALASESVRVTLV